MKVILKLWDRSAGWITLAAEAIAIVLAVLAFRDGSAAVRYLNFRVTQLSSGTFLAVSVISFLITMYSFGYMKGKERLGEYYCYVLLTLISAAGALFASDYFTLLVFWGILGATLYLLIGISGPAAASAAKKTFIIIGGSDAVMIFGIAIIWLLTNSMNISSRSLMLDGPLPVIAFLCLASAAFAKSGVMPLHSWIPDSSEVAPIPVMALLPASLDKLLGIYLLARTCIDIFIVPPNSPISIFLMAAGSITIMLGVMAALVQHDMKKLLSFHAVSQVGYMVLGIGTALPIGIAGGLFHMVNHAVYKSCLFLTCGSVEKSAKTTRLEGLGGLASAMPATFISALIASLSISGIPPLNGFFSKWMIYQSIVDLSGSSSLWVIWLSIAMFGSAFTLASFIKLLHSVYLGQSSKGKLDIKEVPSVMWVPQVILAAICVLFGLFAFALPLSMFIFPTVNAVAFPGSWSPVLATFFLITGLLVGVVIYILGGNIKPTARSAYIGGEKIAEEAIKVPATDFYRTISEYGPLKGAYSFSSKGSFDVYEGGSRTVSFLSGVLSFLHNGLLHTYIAWIFLGFVILLGALILI